MGALQTRKMMQDACPPGVTVEDLARARASFEGKAELAAFDQEQAEGEMTRGSFVAHVVWIERLLMRAMRKGAATLKAAFSPGAQTARSRCRAPGLIGRLLGAARWGDPQVRGDGSPGHPGR